ncbi:hypothetical protein VP01_4035g1 [Puccinia sorghi]|uniref:Uncharacterized protein n=1 Tax=Puccinia sorghi TaxID=27349 RepID=A0A0L6USL3_9BASI|nr:hypothetical protein VP01_4035g1 [Puccinia sorghi]
MISSIWLDFCFVVACRLHLEDAMVSLALKMEPQEKTLAPPANKVDLQKFRTSNGPSFAGIFQALKPHGDHHLVVMWPTQHTKGGFGSSKCGGKAKRWDRALLQIILKIMESSLEVELKMVEAHARVM